MRHSDEFINLLEELSSYKNKNYRNFNDLPVEDKLEFLINLNNYVNNNTNRNTNTIQLIHLFFIQNKNFLFKFFNNIFRKYEKI